MFFFIITALIIQNSVNGGAHDRLSWHYIGVTFDRWISTMMKLKKYLKTLILLVTLTLIFNQNSRNIEYK